MKNILLFVVIAHLFLFYKPVDAKVLVKNLKCEYLENPLGIDTKSPRFTWQIVSEHPGVEQQAWKIIVGTDSEKVAGGEGDFWDSGIVKSSTISGK